MTRTLRLGSSLGITLLALAAVATDSPDETKSAADIVACMRKNVVERGALRQLDVTVTDAAGKIRSLTMKLFWKPGDKPGIERATLQVTEPTDVAGMAYLVRGDEKTPGIEEVYVYLPALDKVQRIIGAEANQPLWGTDFTYAEIQQVQGVVQDGKTTRGPDASAYDRPAFVLVTETDAASAGYASIRSYVDRKTCTLLRAELLNKDGKQVKHLEADLDTLLEVEPWWLVLGYTMFDDTRGSKTRLDMSDVFLLEDLPEAVFTPEGFYKVKP